jgi:Protein of unknown function (DUF4240)
MQDPQIEKAGEIMNEESYWAIVDSSLKTTQNQAEQEQFLRSALKKITPQEIIGFHLTTSHLLNETYTSEMWCAGHIMNTRCSDDGFEDFRCWIISRGKQVYYKAKANPDTLVNEYVEDCEEYAFELFGYVATEAFEETTGEDLLDVSIHPTTSSHMVLHDVVLGYKKLSSWNRPNSKECLPS